MTGSAIRAAWIAVDWGTSHLRTWAMDAADAVLAEARSKRGMASLARADFEPALLELAGPWLGGAPCPALICGMAGSRQGWVEAPYVPVPCSPPTDQLVPAPSPSGRLHPMIVPGVKQAAPADVMRGEETQIAGFLALNPGWDGVACLPGSHTKWAQLSAGEIVSFQSFMTGELFAALSARTVLRHSLDAAWDDAAFGEAVSEALSRPERLAAFFFGIRADDLLHGSPPGVARARLSGLLIGAELAAARPYWLGQQVAILGADALSRAYRDALALQGVPAILADGDRTVLEGLRAAFSRTRHTV